MHYLFVFFHNLSKKHTNCLDKSITRQIGLLFYLTCCMWSGETYYTLLNNCSTYNTVTQLQHKKKNKLDKFGEYMYKNPEKVSREI